MVENKLEGLAKFIYDYSSEHKIGDEKYLIQVFEKFKDLLNLNTILKGIYINTYKTNSLAYYSQGNIYINFQKLVYYFGRYVESFELFDYKDKILLFNLLMSKCILHEIEHAIQENKIIQLDKLIEENILSFANKIELVLKNIDYEMYKKIYHLSPIERQAEIKSINWIILISNEYNNPLLSNYLNLILSEFVLIDYNRKMAPIDKLIKSLGYLNETKELLLFLSSNDIMKMGFAKRIELGLSITKNEYKNAIQNNLLIKRRIK